MKRFFVVLNISVLVLSTCIIPAFKIGNVAMANLSCAKSDFIFQYYDGIDSAYNALKAGTIDILDFPLKYEMLPDALNDPNLKVVPVVDSRMYLFDLNNNYTIADYPGVKSPLHELKFRQAIAFAIDKDYIIENFWYNMAERIDQPLPSIFSNWMNETYMEAGYPYEYNLTRAAQLLDELGFIDTDGNGWRNYPADWPGASNADFTQYPLKVFIRSDHTQRLSSGRYLVQQLESIGIKCNCVEGSSSVVAPPVIEEKNYHIYTAGWRIVYPNAPFFLYHSDNWYPWGPNYVTGMNENNLPNYPQLDELLEEMYLASSFESSREKLKTALGFMVENCITVPYVTEIDYYAHRIEVQGTIYTNVSDYWPNFDNAVLNKYNLLSAYKNDGTPVVIGTYYVPEQLNVIESLYRSEVLTLAMFYENLIYFALENPTNHQPWLAAWNIDSWYDNESDENKTKITFYLTNTSYWIRPVTGEVLGEMTALDFEFTTWYNYQWPEAAHYFDAAYVHHIEVLDNYTVEVYMNISSVWSLFDLNYPIIPKQVWTSFQQLAELKTSVFIEGINVTTPGYLNLTYQDIGAPVTVESVMADGNPLTKYEDYNIEMGKIKIYKDLAPGTVLNVTYYARGNPDGAFPGDLPWQDILVGNGPFYITELVDPFNPGGYIYFKANPYYNIRLFDRDLAVTNVYVSKDTATVGENITIQVEVENQGEISESFELTVYTNETVIGRKTLNLSPNCSSLIVFNWNTDSYDPGKYVIKAEVPILFGEEDASDNIFVDGAVTLTIPLIDVAVTEIMPSKNTVSYGEILLVNVTVENQGEKAVSFEVRLFANSSVISSLNVENLSPQSTMTLPFEWITNGWRPGCYTLAAEADILEWETDTEDNYLTNGIITILLPSTETYLVATPSINEVTLGDSFTLSIDIFNVTDLYGYDIILNYNISLLTANSIQEGPFLKSAGETYIFANTTDNEEGYVRFAVSLLGTPTGVSGNGTLFTINFTASLHYTGVVDLLLTYVDLLNHTIQPIPCLAIDGQITIVEIDIEKCTVVKNETIYEVTAVSNSTIHDLSYDDEEYKMDLNVSGASGTVSFCNITLPKELLNGTLVVLVNGNPVDYTKIENETHITLTFTFHNSRSTIQILVSIIGDLNGDRIVNLQDIVIVCLAYGSTPDSPNWNPIADIIQDNIINLRDAVAVCLNYGKTWQPP